MDNVLAPRWKVNDSSVINTVTFDDESIESKYSITGFINTLQAEYKLTIIGSSIEPIFYPDEVLAMLKMKDKKNAMQYMFPEDFVDMVTREKYGIVTKRKYRDGIRTDQSIKLLTEIGFMKLIGKASMKDKEVMQIQHKLFVLMRDIRHAQNEQLNLLQAKYDNLVVETTKTSMNNDIRRERKPTSLDEVYIYKSTKPGVLSEIIPEDELDEDRPKQYTKKYKTLWLYTNQREITYKKECWSFYGVITDESAKAIQILSEIDCMDEEDQDVVSTNALVATRNVYVIAKNLPDIIDENNYEIEYIK